MYAKDTSRKIKSALHARRMQGKYMAATSPFGYQKDEKDHAFRLNYRLIGMAFSTTVAN